MCSVVLKWLFGYKQHLTCTPYRMGSSDSSLSYWSRNVLARKKMTPEATNRKPATEAIAMPTTSGSDTYSSQCSPLYHQFSPTRHLGMMLEIFQNCDNIFFQCSKNKKDEKHWKQQKIKMLHPTSWFIHTHHASCCNVSFFHWITKIFKKSSLTTTSH